MYTQIQSSEHSHEDTRSIGSYRGNAFTTGCREGYEENCGFKTEILEMSTMTWTSAADFQLQAECYFSEIRGYSTAHTADAVFIIGGLCNEENVVQYKDDVWTKVGELNQRRLYHSSISINDQTMIVGGYDWSQRYVDLWLIRSQMKHMNSCSNNVLRAESHLRLKFV